MLDTFTLNQKYAYNLGCPGGPGLSLGFSSQRLSHSSGVCSISSSVIYLFSRGGDQFYQIGIRAFVSYCMYLEGEQMPHHIPPVSSADVREVRSLKPGPVVSMQSVV